MAAPNNPDMKRKEDEREFALQKLFIKDLSFESPRPVDALINSGYRPNIDLQLNTGSRKVAEDLYEVTLRVTVTAVQQQSGETVYLIEVSQAGLFALKGFTEMDAFTALNSHCPSILFPYAREVVSAVVTQGGFPQLLLKPVNFDALYRQHLEKHQRKTGSSTAAKAG